jgi:hypothetical protein
MYVTMKHSMTESAGADVEKYQTVFIESISAKVSPLFNTVSTIQSGPVVASIICPEMLGTLVLFVTEICG